MNSVLSWLVNLIIKTSKTAAVGYLSYTMKNRIFMGYCCIACEVNYYLFFTIFITIYFSFTNFGHCCKKYDYFLSSSTAYSSTWCRFLEILLIVRDQIYSVLESNASNMEVPRFAIIIYFLPFKIIKKQFWSLIG